ncbi:hypothetical protein PIB30_024978 [Stylosanthes scabra]|uniref:Uncharacterized protein n=1 Tax=Stylosanthes scabra TaxID=79078 RepID=A0ABU6X8B0_9FABA|nr:hypothetical protein [Stylosanthes scabra]
MVTRSSPIFKIGKGSAESTQKGSTGCFGVAATFAHKEPCLDLFQVVVGCGKTIDACRLRTLGSHSRFLYFTPHVEEKWNRDKAKYVVEELQGRKHWTLVLIDEPLRYETTRDKGLKNDTSLVIRIQADSVSA